VLVGTLLVALAYWAGSIVMPQVLDRPGPQAAVIVLLGLGLIAFVVLSVNEQREGRREIDQRLAELQRQYGAAEDLAGLGAWVYDIGRNRYFWSAGAHRLFGTDPQQAAPDPKAFLEAVHPDDRARWQESHRRAIRNGQPARIDYRYRRPDGREVQLSSLAVPETGRSGRARRLAGVVRDISEVSSAALQLAASEAKFRDLAELSADWIWETDAQHCLVTLSETTASAVQGDWLRSVLGQPYRALAAAGVPGPDWPAHQAELEAHVPFDGFEFSLLDPQGRLHRVSLSGRPVFDLAGHFSGYRGVCRVITREYQQQVLLQFESEMAAIMRGQSEPAAVITDLIASLCRATGWLGGVHLVQIAGTRAVEPRERWGRSELLRMLGALPAQMPMPRDSVEGRVWASGRAQWLTDLGPEADFARRYQAASCGVSAAFLAPILNEHRAVTSALLFFGSTGSQDEAMMRPLADILCGTVSLYLQRRTAEQRLMHASLHDALTGLPNRVYLTHQLEECLKAGRGAAVMYVDLDRYKLINDTLGHSVGDQVLIEVARRLRESIRSGDVAGRIGGDEFILLLPDLQDRTRVEAVARKVLAAVERPFVLAGRAHFLSASIGVAMAPDDGTDAQGLIKCADNAMYQTKASGRNDVRFFAGEASDDRVEQLQLGSDFPLALQRGEIVLYYQPVMALGERRIVGIEALMRWRHPTLGLLPADRFLPAAQRGNAMREAGLWAIRRALEDRVAMGLDRFQDVAVSVNLSPHQLAEEGFLAQVNALLAERRFPAHLLRLELTENALIDNSDKTIALLADLRRLGIEVIIDNFGTGYASLSYLKNLPVDGLKIDHTFIRGLPDDRGNAAIVQAITTLAGKLGLQVMAEGVETAAELKALRGMNCERMQGSLISEPLPMDQLLDFLESLPQLRQMHLMKPIAG
jgi:diguanylate cyclase (GGDEF)-like protein/PAS domain S-box-containing protein